MDNMVADARSAVRFIENNMAYLRDGARFDGSLRGPPVRMDELAIFVASLHDRKRDEMVGAEAPVARLPTRFPATPSTARPGTARHGGHPATWTGWKRAHTLRPFC